MWLGLLKIFVVAAGAYAMGLQAYRLSRANNVAQCSSSSAKSRQNQSWSEQLWKRCRAGVAAGGGGGSGSCVVCLDRDATMGYLHGNVVHCCLCQGCYKKLWWRGEAQRCPVCRQQGRCINVIRT